ESSRPSGRWTPPAPPRSTGWSRRSSPTSPPRPCAPRRRSPSRAPPPARYAPQNRRRSRRTSSQSASRPLYLWPRRTRAWHDDSDVPEPPEVETVRRGLQPAMEGARIERVVCRRQTLRFPLPERFTERLAGTLVRRVGRRAKYLLLDL